MRLLTKSTLAALMVFGIGASAFAANPPNLGRRPVVDFVQAREIFRSPEMEFAPFIFWFWDEPLDPAKMGEMSSVMASQGFNPGYAHPRRSMVGTPDLPDDHWLTDKWFDSFGSALKEAESKECYLGFCDEYWWPSFQAHGRVLQQHPELRAESLKWEVIDVPGGKEAEVPACYFAVAAKLADPTVVISASEELPKWGKWIWDAKGTQTKHTCWFYKDFEVPAGRKVVSAVARITVDNSYKLSINDKAAGSGDNWKIPGIHNVAKYLKAGRNNMFIEASNEDGPFGLLFGLLVKLDDGSKIEIGSDSSWKTTLENPAGEIIHEIALSPANVICGADEGVWAREPGGDIGSAFQHRSILSSTLKVIGSGDTFKWKAPSDGNWRVYAFNKYFHPGGFDGQQVNSIDERVGKVFCDIALEPYAKKMGDKLGKSIPGDFIDNEGDYGWQLAWSGSLDQQYKQRYGRDIRLWMPLMLDQDEEGLYAKARWEWFDLVSDLYAANFQFITDWNEKRGMYTTAHVWEESIPAQVNCVGDHLKILRAFTMPGQDCLGTKALQVHDFKEIASVAEFGNTRATTELMGAGGWGIFTPEFLKQSVNAVTAWGMSHIIPHGVFTTRKLTGNPWMPDWYSENPMFAWFNLWNDFAKRASYVNSLGHACPDVLLYNPIESCWALASVDMLDVNMWSFDETSAQAKEINSIDRVYSKAIQDLTEGRIEFLIGDRKYLSEMAVKGSKLVRGPLEFKTIVLPPLEIMPLAVAGKIVEFAKAGGYVFALGSLPQGSSDNGMKDPKMAKLMKELAGLPTFTQCGPSGCASLIEKGSPGLESPVRFVSGGFPMLQSHRRIDNRDFYWLVNNSDRDARECEVAIVGAHGAASIWDCETGLTRNIASKEGRDGSTVSLEFKPLEAYWLVFDPQKPANSSAKAESITEIAKVDGPWTVKCDLSIQPVMEYQHKPGDDLVKGFEKPLEDWSAWGLNKFSGLLDYSTKISLDKADGRLILDLGTVHSAAEVWVNGKPCGKRLWGPYEFDITSAAKSGTNDIKIRVANLINNSYGDVRESGLRGPVRILLNFSP